MTRKIKFAIPSLLTLGNLLCGFLAIASGDPEMVLWLVLVGALFDMLDGLSARLLKATSDFGKQLDSLADIVTFGVAPALAIFHMMGNDIPSVMLASMIPIFSAIRLAKFNIDEGKNTFFTGLPTPANGIFFAALPFIMARHGAFSDNFHWLSNVATGQFWLPVVIIVFSFLMIIPLKMFSLKSIFQKSNIDRYFVAALFVLTFPIALSFGWAPAVPAGVIFYILLSLLYHFVKPETKITHEEKKDSHR